MKRLPVLHLPERRREHRPHHSLSGRLTRMNLLVSGAVLLIAALAFFSFDQFSFRQTLIRNLDAEAQIIGDNTVSALTFNDQQSAAATLASLQRSPDIRAAVVTTPDGTIFARYGNSGLAGVAVHRLSADENYHVWISGIHVVVARRILFQGKTVGIVSIAATLAEIFQRARQYLAIACTILVFCMVAAAAISAISRRLIAQPIVELADTALLVSRDRDYSVRAAAQTDAGEIAVLVDAFNTMLTQIQERDAALNRARNELEIRVEERTAELQAANRELEAFSYTVAHDLRGPLDAISGIAYLLGGSGDQFADPEIQTMLGQLKTSTANMGLLIDDLLNFARASTTTAKSEPVDLSAMVREIAAELMRSDPARHVEFTIDDTPKVLADPGLMRIALDNLLRNAWKYTSHHPKACIEFGAKVDVAPGEIPAWVSSATQPRPVFFIRDDGAGFDPTRMDRLFQPFQRLHGKSDFPGTGIGLATVQRILARQGGAIWAEGAVEKGATFHFTLN
jgi:signal transduction histidine kinase